MEEESEVVTTGPPRHSRFVTYLNDGTPLTSTGNWGMVVLHEAVHVGSWILYMHRRQSPDVRALLTTIIEMLTPRTQGHFDEETGTAWFKLAEMRVPNVILEILCEPQMFSTKEASVFIVVCNLSQC